MQNLLAHTGIVVGTHNNADHIVDAIKSIRSQSDPRWFCVVVDNGSTDATVSVIEKILADDRRFRWHLKANEGPGAGRNVGFSLLPDSIEFVHFLDGDDSLEPLFVERLSGYLQSHADVGLVTCQFDRIDAHGNYLGPGFRSRIGPSRWGWPHQIPTDIPDTPFAALFAATGQGPFAMFRRRIFEQTSGYEESFWSHEDSDIFCQIGLRARVHSLPDRLYRKRTHGNNLTDSPKADYGRFRNKWDHFVSDEVGTNERIEAALRYYYGIHAPLRHLKVATKALTEFVQSGDSKRLDWCLSLIRRGMLELFFQRELSRRLRSRARHISHVHAAKAPACVLSGDTGSPVGP